MNLLNLLILALAYLIGVVIIKHKNDNPSNDAPRRNNKTGRKNARGVRTKVMIGRLRGT